MAKFCASCGSQIADTATFCPACGKPAGQGATVAPGPAPAYATAPAAPVTGGMTDNVAGMLAYFTLIPAIIFLVIEPYNKNRFVRFHSFQSLFFSLVAIAFSILMAMISGALLFTSGMWFLHFALFGLVRLAFFIVWIILVIKANQGQMWKLPVIGDIAEKQANTV